jgi:two-component system response regulator
LEILIVDDNPGDVRLIREALSESSLPLRLHTVGDGEQALAFLRREGAFTDAPRPDFILLDLNLPKRDGRQLVADIRDDEALGDVPVVVFSSSQSDDDIAVVYYHKANCFVTKPVDIDQFFGRIRAIEKFWLRSIYKLRRANSEV